MTPARKLRQFRKPRISKSATKLEPPSRALLGLANQTLDVVGQFKGTLSLGDIKHTDRICVVRSLRNNLLGLPSIMGLQLLANTEAIMQANIMKEFPDIFKSLGTFGEEYKIQVKDDAKSYCLYTPRRIPFALRKQVKEELQRMESLGVISPVSTPTPWCSCMVVVQKKSGAVRICVDLKPLNTSVLREIHPIPRVDEVLAQLKGATVFSMLDANCGFWQIPLAPESRHLTTSSPRSDDFTSTNYRLESLVHQKCSRGE